MEERLNRALSKADFVQLDGWCPRWQFDAVEEARKAGEVSVTEKNGDQYTALIVRRIDHPSPSLSASPR